MVEADVVKLTGWLVTAAIVGGVALVGAHSHGYPYTSPPVSHGVMAEGSGGALKHDRDHVVVVARRITPAQSPSPSPSMRARLPVHVPHPYLGRLLFRRPRLLPWWMRRGR